MSSTDVVFKSNSGHVRFQIDDETGRVLMITPGEVNSQPMEAIMAISISPEDFQRFERVVGMVAMQVVSYIPEEKAAAGPPVEDQIVVLDSGKEDHSFRLTDSVD